MRGVDVFHHGEELGLGVRVADDVDLERGVAAGNPAGDCWLLAGLLDGVDEVFLLDVVRPDVLLPGLALVQREGFFAAGVGIELAQQRVRGLLSKGILVSFRGRMGRHDVMQ